VNGIFRPGMRAYFVPLVAGVVLSVSAFLPWVIVGGVSLNGVPDVWALWVAGLGALAAVLAMLSLITRRNSVKRIVRGSTLGNFSASAIPMSSASVHFTA